MVSALGQLYPLALFPCHPPPTRFALPQARFPRHVSLRRQSGMSAASLTTRMFVTVVINHLSCWVMEGLSPLRNTRFSLDMKGPAPRLSLSLRLYFSFLLSLGKTIDASLTYIARLAD